MSRGLKKFIYGIFYLCLIGVIIFGIYSKNTEKAPTCFDGIMNQGEQGIDCGGLCTPCEIKNLRPIRTDGPAKVFSLENGRAIFFGAMINSNEGYIAEESRYEFVVRDKTGYVTERISGKDVIYPLEKRFVFSTDSSVKIQNIGRVDVEVSSSSVVWKKYYDTLKPNVQIVSPPEISRDGTMIRAKGMVRNQSSFSARNITIFGVFKDKYGDPVFVSQWTSKDLSGLETREFTILVPEEKAIADRIDSEKTSFLVQVQ